MNLRTFRIGAGRLVTVEYLNGVAVGHLWMKKRQAVVTLRWVNSRPITRIRFSLTLIQRTWSGSAHLAIKEKDQQTDIGVSIKGDEWGYGSDLEITVVPDS